MLQWLVRLVRRSGIEVKNYADKDLRYKRGDEIGHFKFGSTVITLWPVQGGDLHSSITSGAVAKMGQPMIANTALANS